jgi:hypothetical protein
MGRIVPDCVRHTKYHLQVADEIVLICLERLAGLLKLVCHRPSLYAPISFAGTGRLEHRLEDLGLAELIRRHVEAIVLELSVDGLDGKSKKGGYCSANARRRGGVERNAVYVQDGSTLRDINVEYAVP